MRWGAVFRALNDNDVDDDDGGDYGYLGGGGRRTGQGFYMEMWP